MQLQCGLHQYDSMALIILGYLELFGGGQQLVPEILHGKTNKRQTGASIKSK